MNTTIVELDSKTYISKKLCKYNYIGCKNIKCKFSHNINDLIIKCKYNSCKNKYCKFYHQNNINLNYEIFPQLLTILFECYLNILDINLIVCKNYIHKYYPQTIDDVYKLYNKFNYFPKINLIVINSCKLKIPKLKRNSLPLPDFNLCNKKVKIDLQNNNECENPGAHDGANVVLYPIDQQIKWFFMNNKQKIKMLDAELNEYFNMK